MPAMREACYPVAGNRVLFVDFDGVLHPTSATSTDWFCCMPRLEDALAGTGCAIVISSSWRHHHPLPALIHRFPAALRARIRGTTGPAHIGKHARYEEIRAYVRCLSTPTDWRALDDSRFEFPPGCRELIACNPNVGIGRAEVQLVQSWLAAPPLPLSEQTSPR